MAWIRRIVEQHGNLEALNVEIVNAILQEMKIKKAYRDTYAILGITMRDLKAEGFCFVYGLALPSAKVGVASFNR